MSFHPQVVQIAPDRLQEFGRNPEAYYQWVEEIQGEGVVFLQHDLADPADKALCVDEFVLSLLTDLSNEGTPLHRALLSGSHILMGVEDGFGTVSYHTAAEVATLADALEQFPEDRLAQRFQEHAADYLMAANGIYNAQEIRALQIGHFRRLQGFYRRAASRGQAVLLILL